MTTAIERPVRKDVARNRALLLQAADEVFAERGVEATLDDIARHAGVGVATAYRHFANKQALLEALFADRIDQVVAIIEQAEAIEDPREGLETLLYRACEQQARDRGMRAAMGSHHGLDKMTQMRERVQPGFVRVFDRAKAAGVVRPECEVTDIGVLLNMIGAVIEFVGPISEFAWRRYLDLVLDGMLAAGQPRHEISDRSLTLAEMETVMAAMHATPRC